MLKHQYKWNEHNITISTYIPVEVYNVLVQEATKKGAANGSYISLSQLVRDILSKHIEEVVKFNGQKYSSDYVIFDLSKSRTIKYDDHVSAINRSRAKKKEAA